MKDLLRLTLSALIVTNVHARDLIETIAHEFVHVKQFDRYELGYDDNGELTWHGVTIEDSVTAPWELDAMFETINIEKELDIIAAVW